MGFDRKLLKNLDWQLWLTTIFISLFSIVVLRSASVDAVPGNPFYYVKRQILFVVLGNILIAASLFFDYRLLLKLTKPIYFFNLVLLMAVLLVGRQGGGAQRWINIGGFLLQPSEFAKIFIIVVLAHYLEKHGAITSWKELLRAGAVVAVPTVLILRQPDLGTSLVFIVIFSGCSMRLKLTGNIYWGWWGGTCSCSAHVVVCFGTFSTIAVYGFFRSGESQISRPWGLSDHTISYSHRLWTHGWAWLYAGHTEHAQFLACSIYRFYFLCGGRRIRFYRCHSVDSSLFVPSAAYPAHLCRR